MRKREYGFFAAADIFGGGAMSFINVVYLFFLINVIKLDPTLASAVILISEIWDAISDPAMGIIGDNTRTRFGRRRPYIFVSGCLIAVAFALLFLPIGSENQALTFIYCTATYLFYNTVSTMFNVSYCSLAAELSTISDERDTANVIRLVVSTCGASVCTLVPSVLLDMYKDGKIDTTVLYLVFGIVFGILFALPVILCAFFVKERVPMPTEKKKLDLKELVQPLKVRPFRQLVGMYLGQAICMDVFAAGIVMFATFVTNPSGSSTIFLAIFIVIQLIAFPIINVLIRRVDVNKIYGFGLPLAVASMVAFAILGSNLYAAYACIFVMAIGFAGAQLTSWIMFPHTVDAGELVTGKRQSGGSSAIMTFTRKTSSAIVLAIFSNILKITGYDADLTVQPHSAQLGIKYVLAFTCIICMSFGFIMSIRYVLSKAKNDKVQKYLAIQRQGALDEMSEEETAEYSALVKSLS